MQNSLIVDDIRVTIADIFVVGRCVVSEPQTCRACGRHDGQERTP
jgi:hypothetical protein